ncbi:MAG: hypothetical protein KKF48_05250, partial [Nanoarchaeota archaeon]|nr:hypothetical protein [Nanoarchaeota archaeon]
MKRGIILLIFIVLLVSLVSVSAVQYTGCGDPSLDTTGYSSCVEIRQSDCNGLPDRCQILSSSNTYYLLMSDIDVPRRAFDISNNNIALDLNEYIITYENSVEVIVPNHNFETGDFSNWDSSGASSASVTSSFPAPRGHWHIDEIGNYVVHFNNPSAGEQIISDPINLELGRPYTISFMVHVNNYLDGRNIVATLDTPLVDGLSGCAGTVEGSNGFSAYYPEAGAGGVWGAAGGERYVQGELYYRCVFTVNEANPRVILRTIGAISGDVYVDSVEIKPAEEIGIYSSSADARVFNGNIFQGKAKGYYAKALDVRGTNSEVFDLNVSVYGPDAWGMTFGGSNQDIHDNEINHNVKRTHHAHDSWYSNAISLGFGPASVDSRVYNNIIPISSAGIVVLNSNNLSVYNNSIDVVSNSIHGYAIQSNGATYSYFYDNFINTTLGSGIFAEGGTRYNSFYNNYVEVRDGPQEERYWTAKALWMRYSAGGNSFYNNTFIGYGGRDMPRVGEDTSLSTVRLGAYSDVYGPIRFYDNYVEARMNDADANFPSCYDSLNFRLTGIALDLGSDGSPGITKYIQNNTFKSDHHVVTFGGRYWVPSLHSYLTSNILVRGDNALPEYSTISHFYASNGGSADNLLLDTTGLNGADVHDIFICNTASTALDTTIAWYLDVNVFNAGSPVDANVYVESLQQPSTNFNDNTGGDGTARFTLTEQHIGGAGNSPSITTYAPYNVTVTY